MSNMKLSQQAIDRALTACPTKMLNGEVDIVVKALMAVGRPGIESVEPFLMVIPDLRLLGELQESIPQKDWPEYFKTEEGHTPSIIVPLFNMGDTNEKRVEHMRMVGREFSRKMVGLQPFGVVMANEAYMKVVPKDSKISDVYRGSLKDDPKAQEVVTVSALTMDGREAATIILMSYDEKKNIVFGEKTESPAKDDERTDEPGNSLIVAFFEGSLENARDNMLRSVLKDSKLKF